MERSDRIDKLVAARETLRNSINKSRNAAKAIYETGWRLEARRRNLSFLESGFREMASGFSAYEITRSVDRAMGPASALPKVLNVVYELQDSLEKTEPHHVLVYIANIKRTEAALKLLGDNCRLVILWLEDIFRFRPKDNPYFINVSKVVKILEEVQTLSENGGVLAFALNKLETRYRNVLTEFSFPILSEGTTSMEPDSIFPAPVLQELRAITRVLSSHNRLDRCISIYADVRIQNARASLVNPDYLDIQSSNVEDCIDQWDKHMEFAVRRLLRTEYNLCREVLYEESGSDMWMRCFGKISTQCGLCDIFSFAISVTKCKKEAVKLLKLLKIFSTLDRLRLDFNELFHGKFCVEIQNQTRDLIKKVVYGVSEIFWELLVQVELQRETCPTLPSDGSVPGLVLFVTEYCNQLLEDDNRIILNRVLEIYQDWNNMKLEEGLLLIEIRNIMKALEFNLENWAKRYDDEPSLSCLFLMNNHWYLCNNTRGTLLGDLMGESWLSKHEESVEHYAKLYLRESWEKLLVLLHEEGLTLFPGGRAVDRNMVKKRIHVFGEAFDDMYRKQSKWIVFDKALRWKLCELVFETIVPPHKTYLERFMGNGLEQDLRYSSESLEKLIYSLFQPRIGSYGSTKCTDLIDIKNSATSIIIV